MIPSLPIHNERRATSVCIGHGLPKGDRGPYVDYQFVWPAVPQSSIKYDDRSGVI